MLENDIILSKVMWRVHIHTQQQKWENPMDAYDFVLLPIFFHLTLWTTLKNLSNPI